MPQRLLYLLLLAIACCSKLPTSAQVHLPARVLTTEKGLSDNRITCFFKDRTGFVWIGTQNGLNRYDGRRMQVFRPSTGNSLSNEVINDVAEDSRGNIWVATMDGLNRYSPQTGRWECLRPAVEKSGGGIPSNLIWDIHIDEEDRIWIASDVRQFCFYQPTTKKFTYFDWPQFIRNNPAFGGGTYHSIKRFVYKNKNEILLASNKALVKLYPNTGQFVYLGGAYRSDVLDLRYDSAAQKAFASLTNGQLLVWDEKRQTVQEMEALPEAYPSQKFEQQTNHDCWLPAGKGLLKIDAARQQARLSQHIPQLSGSLLPGGVTAVLETPDGITWVGTPNGICIYDRQFQPATFLPLLPALDTEGSNGMGGVWFDAVHQRYFVCATEAGAVFLFDRRSQAIRKLTQDAAGRSFGRCNTVVGDAANGIWLLTDNAVYRYHEGLQSFQHFPTPNKGEDVVFRDLAQDAEGNYWLGSFHNGLYYYRSREKKFDALTAQGFSNVLTTTSLLATAGRRDVWIGTYSIGFYRYDVATQTLTPFLETDTHPEHAALNLTNDVAKDAADGVWAATQAGGLFRFTHKSNQTQIDQYSMRSGLTENSYASLCAVDSTMWALSGSGLTVLSTEGIVKQKPVTGFRFSAYLSDVRFSHQMAYDSLHHELLVAVGGGLLIHQTGAAQSLASIPVLVTGAKANDQALQAGHEALLEPGQNNLHFSFASLYYGADPHYRTEYFLEGWDKQWTVADVEGTAVYQNLSPGRYRFLVRTKNSTGKIVGSAQWAPFRIKPPFWQRWWAIAVLASLFLAALYLFFNRRENAIRKQAAIRQQLTELESRALRAQMNPHFIFNSLNAIQELVVTENGAAAYDYLSKFSKLLRLVLNNSEKPLIPLSDELALLRLYLELEALRFRQSFSYQLVVDEQLDGDTTFLPPLLLQPFIENAIWHGLSLKEGEKKLVIRIAQQEQLLLCTIEDNGIGRKRSAEIKAQKLGAAHFESKGLKLSRHRLNLLKAEGFTADVKIEDLYVQDEAAGTRVVVLLPLLQQ